MYTYYIVYVLPETHVRMVCTFVLICKHCVAFDACTIRLQRMHNLCLAHTPCWTASNFLLFQRHAYLQNGGRFSCSAGQSGPLENCV